MDRERDILGEESAALGGESRIVRICFRKVKEIFDMFEEERRGETWPFCG